MIRRLFIAPPQLAARVVALLFVLTGSASLQAAGRDDQRLWEELRLYEEQEARRTQQLEDDLDEKRRIGERADRELAELKQRLAACGQCAEKAGLEARIAGIENRRRQAMIVQCALVSSMMESGNRVGAGALQMTGLPQRCREAGLDPAGMQDAEHRTNLEQLEAQARKSGQPADQFAVAEYLARPMSAIHMACPWYMSAARQGHMTSARYYAGSCAWRLEGAELARDRAAVLRFVQACADKGDPACVHSLARFQDPVVIGKARESLMPVNQDAALRLYERAIAMAPQNDVYRKSLERLKVHLGLSAPPPEPAKPLGLPPVALRTGVYAVDGPGYRGECVVRALGNHRYSFEWRLRSLGRVAVPGTYTLESSVEGETITFVSNGVVRQYRRQESPQGFRLVSNSPYERLTWQSESEGGATEASGPPPNTQPRSGRSLESQRRCERLAQNAERAQEQAARNSRYGSRAERALAEYRSECGG